MGHEAVIPVMFIMENGLEISSSSNGAGADDLTRIKEFVEEHVGDIYHITTVSNFSPIQQGYPTEKKRFIVVGARNEQFDSSRQFDEYLRQGDCEPCAGHTHLLDLLGS